MSTSETTECPPVQGMPTEAGPRPDKAQRLRTPRKDDSSKRIRIATDEEEALNQDFLIKTGAGGCQSPDKPADDEQVGWVSRGREGIGAVPRELKLCSPERF